VFVAGAGPKIKHPSAARTVERVVFESWEFEIQLERVERTGERTALAVGPEWSYQPQYSPDGGRLAFVSTRSGSPQIWLSARDGSGVLQLTNAPLGQVATPRWSPSGREVVFVGRPAGEADLYLVPADGSGVLRRLTETPGDESLRASRAMGPGSTSPPAPPAPGRCNACRGRAAPPRW
jgi:dipeptidyl aminopeptidase/acylaminoacyl peptidase